MTYAEHERHTASVSVDENNKDVTFLQTDDQVNHLLLLAGVCEGGPSDLADNHDLYLRGNKKV